MVSSSPSLKCAALPEYRDSRSADSNTCANARSGAAREVLATTRTVDLSRFFAGTAITISELPAHSAARENAANSSPRRSLMWDLRCRRATLRLVDDLVAAVVVAKAHLVAADQHIRSVPAQRQDLDGYFGRQHGQPGMVAATDAVAFVVQVAAGVAIAREARFIVAAGWACVDGCSQRCKCSANPQHRRAGQARAAHAGRQDTGGLVFPAPARLPGKGAGCLLAVSTERPSAAYWRAGQLGVIRHGQGG